MRLLSRSHIVSTQHVNITTQIIAQVASNQYGGVPTAHLAPFVGCRQTENQNYVEKGVQGRRYRQRRSPLLLKID